MEILKTLGVVLFVVGVALGVAQVVTWLLGNPVEHTLSQDNALFAEGCAQAGFSAKQCRFLRHNSGWIRDRIEEDTQ